MPVCIFDTYSFSCRHCAQSYNWGNTKSSSRVLDDQEKHTFLRSSTIELELLRILVTSVLWQNMWSLSSCHNWDSHLGANKRSFDKSKRVAGKKYRERRLVKPVKFLFLKKMGLLNTIKLSNEWWATFELYFFHVFIGKIYFFTFFLHSSVCNRLYHLSLH